MILFTTSINSASDCFVNINVRNFVFPVKEFVVAGFFFFVSNEKPQYEYFCGGNTF